MHGMRSWIPAFAGMTKFHLPTLVPIDTGTSSYP